MGKDIQATIRTIDSTDVLAASNRVEELRRQLAEKEQAAQKARLDLERFEESMKRQFQRSPALLDEFNAELIELARRREERSAREARINVLRKQTQH